MARRIERQSDGRIVSKVEEGTEAQGQPISFRLPVSLDSVVRAIPGRSEWLNRIVREALEREGKIPAA